jgi:hypothetical protein
MMMNLGLGWRRGYSAMAGLKSTFTHLPMQLLSGDSDSNTLYINQPTVGAPGPNLSFNAVEFNQGTAIERAVSRSNQFFISTPTAFHTRTLFYLTQLTETVIWALVPAKSMDDVTVQFRLRLVYADSVWKFFFENLTGPATAPVTLWGLYSSADHPITVPGWYNVITSIPYTVNSNYAHIYVNDFGGGASNGYLDRPDNEPYQNLALFFSVADDDLYDGILGQTEGARRLVGRVADFAYSFSDLLSSDYDPSYPKEFSTDMALRLYRSAFTQSSPFESPHKKIATPRMNPKYKNSLQTQLGFRGTLR